MVDGFEIDIFEENVARVRECCEVEGLLFDLGSPSDRLLLEAVLRDQLKRLNEAA